jgi:hypothetical protein
MRSLDSSRRWHSGRVEVEPELNASVVVGAHPPTARNLDFDECFAMMCSVRIHRGGGGVRHRGLMDGVARVDQRPGDLWTCAEQTDVPIVPYESSVVVDRWNRSSVLRGCLSRHSILAEDLNWQTDCEYPSAHSTCSAHCMLAEVIGIWSSASRLGCF